ncbi:3-hydroxyacyl-CoA dehydrogenase NAD-binding domain-containing protein [Sulfitobacter sp. PR48]|uniref:3-hydroxyacyl-CoA dehydrogenase NAD-binding domain-containing protein n=1 Tax=Sulfitobacter sp. PR48 TaxID=3028383 RepID=UPI00237A8114|nr:3-hydroxyacyl-CoA dehydrogenase NAD-binding domain-containing protein [Sulfitobacter sp. PR48]MDD9721118.1 3-hydroxyacyl-CoA dehydrogenase NAD-binding domain-containing protein [Sulfitobacter sp. PR48]
MTADANTRDIAIIGAGLIGTAWAALFAHHGFRVRLWDPHAAALDKAVGHIPGLLAQLAQITEAKGGAERITRCDRLDDAVAGATLIQENAPENIPLKHALLAEIEEAMAVEAIIASSTSALTWSELAPGLREPARLITAHPFNPPHLVQLVELFGADDARLDRAEAIYRAADRMPVRLRKDATGHIANRLASALWREAVFMVQEGIADVEAIDAALVNGPGLRWSVLGAHMAYHLGGGAQGMAGYLAHLGPSQERRWAALGAPVLSPEVCAALIEGVETAAGGRSIAELEQDRDAALIALLRARAMKD